MGDSNATCISLGPKQGGITLACRECGQSGYQPFKGASALEFWIRDQNGSSTIPDVQARSLFLKPRIMTLREVSKEREPKKIVCCDPERS